MLTVISLISTLLYLSIFGVAFLLLPTQFRISERLAIVLAFLSTCWILSSYLALLVFGKITAFPILLVWFCVFVILSLVKSRNALRETGPHFSVLHRIRRSLRRIPLPSVPTVLFLLFLVLFVMVSFQPIAPLGTDFSWFDILDRQEDKGEIRQFAFLGYIGLPYILLFLLLFAIFVCAFFYEPNQYYVALNLFLFACVLVLGPILLLGRPWGTDSYTLGWLVDRNAAGDFGFSEINFPGFLELLNILFYQDMLQLSLVETISVLFPLTNCQVFLGIWIVFTNRGTNSTGRRSILLLMCTAPILLQLTRIASSLVLGTHYMLMAFWFLEKKRRIDSAELAHGQTQIMLLPIILFSTLTGVHHVTALALIVLFVLYPIVDFLTGGAGKNRDAFFAMLGVYAFLELGQFFEWRATPILESLGVVSSLFNPLFIIIINGGALTFRPVYLTLILLAAVFVFILVMMAKRHFNESWLRRRFDILYKLTTRASVLIGLVLCAIIVLAPTTISYFEQLLITSFELLLFYPLYVLLIPLMPFLLNRTSIDRGVPILCYSLSHVFVVIPQALFHIIDGGIVFRLTITLPLLLGMLEATDGDECPFFCPNKILVVALTCVLAVMGIAGSLLVRFYT